MEKVGIVLKHYRERKGLTQKMLANSIGISTDRYSKWERGEREPGIRLFFKLMDILGIEIEIIKNVLLKK